MKRDELLKKKKSDAEEYDLTEQEKIQLGAIMNLVAQAQQAQDILYTNLIENIADRLEISNKSLDINMQEVMKEGAKVAKLVAKDA